MDIADLVPPNKPADSSPPPPVPPIAQPDPVPPNPNGNGKTVKPVHIDGILYVLIAVCGSAIAALSTDEAVKLISVAILFWGKFCNGCIMAGALALKTFRDKQYAHSVD